MFYLWLQWQFDTMELGARWVVINDRTIEMISS